MKAPSLDLGAIRVALSDPSTVARLLGLQEGALRQAGGGLTVRCPAHGDRSPSCSLTRGPNGTLRVKCFSCDLRGDVFPLIAAVEGLHARRDFYKVKLRAAELAGVDATTPASARRPALALRPPPAPSLGAEDFAILADVLLGWGRLDGGADDDAACDVEHYLDGRGLLSLARRDGWAALPPRDRQAAWVAALAEHVAASPLCGPVRARELIDMCGLFMPERAPREEAQGVPRFSWPHHRLVIPWRAPDGTVATLQRRALVTIDGQPRYVFPRGTDRQPRHPYGAEHVSRVPQDAPVAFVEGAPDVLALRAILATRGDPGLVLGLPGLEGWRSEWSELARGRVAFVAIDTDEAGERKAADLARDLANAGAARVVRRRPSAKDWAAVLEAMS